MTKKKKCDLKKTVSGETETTTTKPFDWKITLTKLLVVGAYVGIAAAVEYFTGSPYAITLVPILVAVQNVLKNKYNIQLGW